ncbi:MAG TPA: hypothetical protein VIK86_01270 [Candidatus Paceibacterota bacterium]
MKIEIGIQVKGKLGTGIISKIITKSTGYVEVNYNGTKKNEMAFNLTDLEGNSLKNKPQPTKSSYVENWDAKVKYALQQETGRTVLTLEQLKKI